MSVQQLALYEALGERAEELARMYIGALIVLANPDNPDRLPQAAHSLRELMEKIPKYKQINSEGSKLMGQGGAHETDSHPDPQPRAT
jgi:hypothetical protein